MYDLLNMKFEKDWREYRQKATQESKENIFRNSYRNAIALEWLWVFENVLPEDDLDTFELNDIQMKHLLGLGNLVETLTEYVYQKDSVLFEQGAFETLLEEYFEGVCNDE